MFTPIDSKSEIKRLYNLGFGIHLLKSKSKVPVKGGWSSDNREILSALLKEFQPGLNVGTKLGKPSLITTPFDDEGYLAVIDVDVKGGELKHQNAAKAKVEELFPGLLNSAPITLSGRGNGSMHIWVLVEEPVDSCALYASNEQIEVLMPSAKPTSKQIEILGAAKVKAGWRLRPAFELDFMCAGRQVVLPPSVHPDTGKKYKWKNPINDGGDIPFVDIKSFLETFQVTKKTQVGRPKNGSVSMITPVDVDEMELEIRLKPGVVDNIIEGSEVSDRSAECLSIAMNMIYAGFTDAEIIGVLTNRKFFIGDVAFEHAQTKNRMKAARWAERYCLEKAKAETSNTKDFDDEVEIYETLDDEAKEKQSKAIIENAKDVKEFNWKINLDRTEKGNHKTTFKNVVLILENVIGSDVFKFDDFSKQIFYGCSTPWGFKKGSVLTNIDAVLVLDWFANSDWQMEPNENMIDKAIRKIAHNNSFHPVREYLNSVVWDGTPRIKTWLKDFLTAKGDDLYLETISEIFLVAAVARVFEPGVKYEYMIILEGQQGVGKSTVGRILAGDDWFFDSPLDLHDKDSSLNLQGQWIVEMGELANLRKADVTTIKSFLSRSTDKFRPPFEKSTVSFARQCVFFGTTNDSSYLKDPTGNRRFFPIKVGKIDLDGLKEIKDQLWAEAVFCYEMGTDIFIKDDEIKRIAAFAQDEKVVEDTQSIMNDLILEWSESVKKSFKDNKKDPSKFRLKILDLFEDNMFPGSDDVHIKSPLTNFKYENNYNIQLAGVALNKAGFEKFSSKGLNKWRFKT